MSQASPFSSFDKCWDDLLCGRRAGHMGMFEYESEGMKEWNTFISEESLYYPPAAEIELAQSAEKMERVLSRIGKSVTLVARGPGTTFKEKDGALAKLLENKGSDIKKIIYIDNTRSALKNSVTAGWEMFPNAEHTLLRRNFLDENLCYQIAEETEEVNTIFGLTVGNVEGHVEDGPPKKFYVNSSRAIYNQMTLGAHLLQTVDINQNKEENETCYQHIHAQTFTPSIKRNIDAEHLFEFEVEFHTQAHILARYLKFKSDTALQTSAGRKIFSQGSRLHWNTSLKLPLKNRIAWEKEAGFECLDDPSNIPFDESGRIGLMHQQKPLNASYPSM